MAGLEIYLFGVGKVRHRCEGSRALTPSVRALLAYLVLNRDRPHHRDLLVHEFWGDVDDACARNRLSTALWRLRKVLEPHGVPTGSYLIATRSGEVGFNSSSDYWLDVADFESAAAKIVDRDTVPDLHTLTAFERTASALANELLEGADEPWLALERERLAQLYLSATARCMERYAALGELDHAIDSGRRILQREPLREDAHRALIRLYKRTGQRSEARRQYDRCRQLLIDELGVTPLPETVAAAAAIDDTPLAGGDRVVLEQVVMTIEKAARDLSGAVDDLKAIAHLLSAMRPSS